MWLEAILSREDLEHALRAMTPATLTLGAHGSISFGAPVAVTLVAGRGLRVVCPATVHGSFLHVDVPVTVAAATVLLEPSIAPREGRPVLAFKLSVESVDVAALPHILEDVAVRAINDGLVSHDAELVWDFRRTLSHCFTLPDVLTPSRTIDLSAAWGELRITEAALVLAISVHTIVDAPTSVTCPQIAEHAEE